MHHSRTRGRLILISAALTLLATVVLTLTAGCGRSSETGARAIFLETGASPELANQLATETGVTVVTDLYSHSLTDADGPAPTYIDMMKTNTRMIVEALR